MKIHDDYKVKNYDEEVKILTEALESESDLSGSSSIIKSYEQGLCGYFESNHAVAVSSGSSALISALYCSNVRAGDEVIISALAPLPSALPILALNAVPVFADIEETGIGIDIVDLEKKITPKTKAVIHLPLWGYPYNLNSYYGIQNDNEIISISDSAHAHGSLFQNKSFVHYCDLDCYSTHNKKILSTGEGGFVLSNNPDLIEKLSRFSKLGNLNGHSMGVNFKLSALQAAIGRSRLNLIKENVSRRNQVAENILSQISHTSIKELHFPINSKPNHYSLPLILSLKNEDTKKFKLMIKENYGISTDQLTYNWDACYNHAIFNKFRSNCSNAIELIRRVMIVPIRPDMTEEEIEYISNALIKTYAQFKTI